MDKYTKSIEAITKQFGTSYYFATRFLPSDLRQATYALYSFFRIPDEIVDNTQYNSDKDILVELQDWQEVWERAYHGYITEYPVLNLTSKIFHTYHIPYQYSLDFLAAMKQDIIIKEYKTYKDLQEYMYGSASVVGLMMTYIIGYTNEKALEYAPLLGEAMQMTNFLRDIGEDYDQRRRIYIPQDDLVKYKVTKDMIQSHRVTAELVNCLQYQIQHTRALYRESDKGLQYLNKRGRFAVIMASRMYEAILGKIEQNHYNVLTKRARTSKREKVYILGKAALEYGFQE